MVALSVWGNPEMLKLQWNGTGLGFSNVALARNDGLLVLDEIGEADAATVSKTAYSVINGKSKIQANKDGGNRALHEWRVLLFSTGEYSLKAYTQKGGQKWEAGQNVRLPSIPAATQYGIFEDLCGFGSGADLANYLKAGTGQHYGLAGRAFVQSLGKDTIQRVNALKNEFLGGMSLQHQAGRVAERFALAAAALELAAPVTGLLAGVGMAGVRRCFDDWLEINGTGKFEDEEILDTAMGFFEQHADSMRFVDWDSPTTNNHHAGYRQNTHGTTKYWVTTQTFTTEICKGKDSNKVCRVLHEVQWLEKPNGKGYQFKRFNSGRYYRFNGEAPPDQNSTPPNNDDRDIPF